MKRLYMVAGLVAIIALAVAGCYDGGKLTARPTR